MSRHPYEDELGVIRSIPLEGIARDEVRRQLTWMAEREDRFWLDGKVSGTIYAGDSEHYDFLVDAFGPFAHVNALQRDLCPSATKFESEIIAMTLDLLHGDAATDPATGERACGSVTGGGTESIITAMLTYRDWGRATRGIERPAIVLPVTAHPAFHKAAHLFGMDLVLLPVDERTTLVDPDDVRRAVVAHPNTIVLVGSAGNYPYGTIDPIAELSAIALEHEVGLHVDACLGGFILPWGEELGYDIPVFDYRLPGVTSISADTHKYGYGLKGTSVVTYRTHELRSHQYFTISDWQGGKYFSPGLAGSRSGGLLAATWAALVSVGRDGYLRHARAIFETAFAMQRAVTAHPELHLMGDPTWCFSFTSDEFDIYHVNDHMQPKGWRFNGQQYPNAIHFCVTRPQAQPGVVDAFTADLDEAVAYAAAHTGEPAQSGAIYGGVPGGSTPEVDELVRDFMVQFLDDMQDVPPA